jgi:N-acyl amino acid synthase of PEP-CTERM/exosortase system
MFPRRASIWNAAIGGEATTAQTGEARYHLTSSLRSHFKIRGFQPETLEPILMNDVVAAFNEYFEVIYPDTPELLREVFRLRYRVLCIEQRLPGFDASCYPEEYECDSYDDHSAHILLRHSPSGDFVGTARLILPDPRDPEKPFPIERHTRFDPALFDINSLPRQHIAEISRLLVGRRFRRRKEDNEKVEGEATVEERSIKKQRRFPHPILALVVGIIRMSAQHNITRCLSVMDPSLNRLLVPFGLQFDAIGPLIEYHGVRRPYHIDLQKMLRRMYVNNRQIWELITDFGSVKLMPEKKQLEAPSYETEKSCS